LIWPHAGLRIIQIGSENGGMEMAVLVLNRYPAHLAPYQQWLSELEEDLYIFSIDRHAKGLEGDLVKGFADYERNGLIETEALKLFQEKGFSRIIALAELDIVRAARLRERLKLEGQRLDSAVAFRNKIVMKELISKKGICCPAFSQIEHALDLYDFVKKHGLPIVIKPVDSMGAAGVEIIRNHEQLQSVYSRGFTSKMMAETYIQGDMYEIDGLLVNNEIKLFSVGRYHIHPGSFGDLFTELLTMDHPMYKRLRAYVRDVLDALPITEIMNFHCEVFHTKEDEIIFCEIGSRAPGLRLVECIKQAYGVHMEEAYVKLACGIDYQLPEQQKMKQVAGLYMIPKKQGELVSMIEEFPFSWVAEYQPWVRKGYVNLSPVKAVSDIIGTVVIVAPTADDLKENLKQLRSYIDSHIKWRPL
jgi:ATP-grasp domain